MYILLGIGNPGSKYENTPHNIGFTLVDSFATTPQGKAQHKALTQKVNFEGTDLLLAKPTTYVNLSGESAQSLLAYYKLKPESLIVITDDVNLDFGAIRIRKKGSHGGHNGLSSIIQHCGENFVRIRIGVGKCPPHFNLSNYVLRKLKPLEINQIDEMKPHIQSAVKKGLSDGWESAAAQFNRKSL